MFARIFEEVKQLSSGTRNHYRKSLYLHSVSLDFTFLAHNPVWKRNMLVVAKNTHAWQATNVLFRPNGITHKKKKHNLMSVQSDEAKVICFCAGKWTYRQNKVLFAILQMQITKILFGWLLDVSFMLRTLETRHTWSTFVETQTTSTEWKKKGNKITIGIVLWGFLPHFLFNSTSQEFLQLNLSTGFWLVSDASANKWREWKKGGREENQIKTTQNQNTLEFIGINRCF